MKNWKYTIETAKELREIINNSDSSYEDCQKVLNEIIIICSCIREILNPKDREIWVDSFDDMIRDVQDAIEAFTGDTAKTLFTGPLSKEYKIL